MKKTVERLREMGVNAETVQRPKLLPFTQLVSDEITEEMRKQDEFGLKKYGKPLDPFDKKYDWLLMAQQELADCLKYFKAEQVRRDYVLNEVIMTLSKYDDPNLTLCIEQLLTLKGGEK